MPNERELRQTVVEVCRWMHQRGLLASKDGNVSIRDQDRLLVTPAARPKGRLVPEDLVWTDLQGRPEPGQPRAPTSELAMHVAAYRVREDVGAVVHAHPPIAIAHTVAGIPLDEPLLPEALVELGRVPTIPFTLPGTDAVPKALEGPIRNHDVLLLERHGSLTVGRDLEEAYGRLETLEHTARISWIARQLVGGAVSPLSAETQAQLCPDT